MRIPVLAVLAGVALVLPASASAAESKPLITKVFHVADLVIPIPDLTRPDSRVAPGAKPEPAAIAAGGERLIKQVTAMVRPNSWDVRGGPGKIEFAEASYGLTVTQTAEALREVGDLLDGLRRLQDESVATEVRVMKVPAGFCERVGVKATNGGLLSDRELKLLLEAAQGDREANIQQFPKVTTLDGQAATIRAGERRQFTTGGEVVRVKGQTIFVPKSTEVELGDTLTLCGRIAADRKSMNLRIQFQRTALVGNVELIPVTLTIQPVFEGGSRGQPIPFTQFVQAPDLRTQSVEKTAVLPDGGTVILGGWTETGDAPSTPVMSKIPYISKLFKTTGETKQYEVLVLATTRIIQSSAEPAAAAPAQGHSQR